MKISALSQMGLFIYNPFGGQINVCVCVGGGGTGDAETAGGTPCNPT